MTKKAKTREIAKRDQYDIVNHEIEELRDVVKSTFEAGVTEFDIDRVTVPEGKSKAWSIVTPEGEEHEETIVGTILLPRRSRGWWPDRDVLGQPPSCSSQNGDVGSGDRGDGEGIGQWSCVTCPKSQFHDGEPPECKESKQVFFLFPSDTLPVIISFPPTSLRNFSKFVYSLSRIRVPYWKCQVELGLDPQKNPKGQPYNKITMKMVRKLSDSEVESIEALRGELLPFMKETEVAVDA